MFKKARRTAAALSLMAYRKAELHLSSLQEARQDFKAAEKRTFEIAKILSGSVAGKKRERLLEELGMLNARKDLASGHCIAH